MTNWVLGERAQVAACVGKEGDATPFTEVTVDNISNALHQCGYQRRGWEVMYNGHTGRRLQAQIFLNPTYYQRLKHMVRCLGTCCTPVRLRLTSIQGLFDNSSAMPFYLAVYQDHGHSVCLVLMGGK